MAIYKLGEAPWEVNKQKFPLGQAPWEIQELPKEPNYFQRVGSAYSRAGEDIISEIQKSADIIAEGAPSEAYTASIRAGLRTVGGVAATAFTPILELPGIKQATEFVVKKIVEQPIAQDLIRKATNLAIKYPETAKDLKNVVDIATLGLGSAVEKPLLYETKAVAQDIFTGAKTILTPSEEAIQKKILTLFQKSIKPTAKKTLVQAEKYETDTLNALKTIKTNTDKLNIEDATGELISGRTPQSINELAQGLDQTKKIVFTQYDTLAKQAGTKGAIIDAKPIADEVVKVAENKALK